MFLQKNVYKIWTYRGEEFGSRDGRAVTVQFDPTAQVKVTDFDWRNLAKQKEFFSVCVILL